MNLSYFLSCVVVLAIGGIITVTAAYYFIKDDLRRYFNLKNTETNMENYKLILPLRLQAHERMIVFVERLNPSNLFLRVHEQGISIKELQVIISNEIRSEYQHNIAQQLYINSETWNVIRKLKEDTLAMVGNAVNGLPEGALGIDLSRKILQHMASLDNNPYDLTLDLVKKDIQQLF